MMYLYLLISIIIQCHFFLDIISNSINGSIVLYIEKREKKLGISQGH